jgi:hypothetical protein
MLVQSNIRIDLNVDAVYNLILEYEMVSLNKIFRHAGCWMSDFAAIVSMLLNLILVYVCTVLYFFTT